MIPVHLAKLVVHASTGEPIAILVAGGAEDAGADAAAGSGGVDDPDRCLVISVRPPQAEVIASGPRATRGAGERLPQDLVADLAAALGRRLAQAEITDLVDGRFHADLVLDDATRLGVRPSDALALAVRDELPILVADAVLDEAGQSFRELWGDRPAPPHEQVAELRRALDGATAEDFGAPGT